MNCSSLALPCWLQIRRLLLEVPSLVVVDEAHALKSRKALPHQALSQVATRRRIALTGYPLQNNLDEYYTMICWVGGAGGGWRR
jgi:transcriptional regulator ATRX